MKPFARVVVGVLLLGLAVAQAAHAGTAYIPLPGIDAVGPVGYRTQIAITNTAEESITIDSVQLGPGADGTLREGLAVKQLRVAPQKTFVFRPAAGARGLLELDAAPGLHYSARLIGTDGGRVDLPVMTSENVALADQMLVVQGLEGTASRSTGVVIVNLGENAASCSASVARSDGSYVIEPVDVAVPARSHLVFSDIFRGISGGIAEARVEVTCSNDFYVYALIADALTGRVAIAVPSVMGDSLATRTDEVLFKASKTCSTSSLLCAMPGLIHSANKSNPTLALRMTPPAGIYSSLKAHVEVKVTGWNPVNERGAHGVLYLIINKNKFLMGSIFMRGPGKHNVTLRHGICPQGCFKSKVERKLTAELGTTYVFDYEYNPAKKGTDLRVTHKEQLVARIQDKPNVNKIEIKPGDEVVIGLSNPFCKVREEPCSLGWSYSNLSVEFVR